MAVSALAVVGTVVVAQPGIGQRRGLANEVVAGVSVPVVEVTEMPVVVTPPPSKAPRPTQTLKTPLRPAPSLTRKPKEAKPNFTVSSGKLSVVPGFDKASGTRGKLTYRVEIERGLSARRGDNRHAGPRDRGLQQTALNGIVIDNKNCLGSHALHLSTWAILAP